jgi:hypothetical protein
MLNVNSSAFEMSINKEDLTGNIANFIEELAEQEGREIAQEDIDALIPLVLNDIDNDTLHNAIWDAIDDVCRDAIGRTVNMFKYKESVTPEQKRIVELCEIIRTEEEQTELNGLLAVYSGQAQHA